MFGPNIIPNQPNGRKSRLKKGLPSTKFFLNKHIQNGDAHVGGKSTFVSCIEINRKTPAHRKSVQVAVNDKVGVYVVIGNNLVAKPRVKNRCVQLTQEMGIRMEGFYPIEICIPRAFRVQGFGKNNLSGTC
jgi:hypothetical protein